MKRYIYILLSLLLVISCEPKLPQSPEMLVVEGWIENDGTPKVFVTSSISATLDRKDITDLIEHVALDADVTITHDGVTYPLKPVIRNEYLLRICYTTNSLKGVTGGTYRLDVKWKDMQASAVTTILPPAAVDSITVEQHQSIDTLYVIKVRPLPVQDITKYMFFSMDVGKDSTYLPSYMGTLDTKIYHDKSAVNRGNGNPIKENNYFYSLGDSVRFKIATIDDTTYDFWSRFDELRMFSHVALIPYSANMNGNIQGGLGYFFGYGVTSYSTVVK